MNAARSWFGHKRPLFSAHSVSVCERRLPKVVGKGGEYRRADALHLVQELRYMITYNQSASQFQV